MILRKLILKVLTTFVTVVLLTGCSESKAVNANFNKTEPQIVALDVYKSPTCGCCKKWVNHIEEYGFQSKVYNVSNISVIKQQHGIAARYRSCHTAVSIDGYIFEGHVPAKIIQQFLQENHSADVLGLSVPAMPLGSPGMEVGDKFMPYRVLLLKSDQSFDIYVEVQSYEQQF